MEAMEQKLLKVAIEGNTTLLLQLHGENPLLLDRVSVGYFNETPLHVAALRGHVDFAKQLVHLNPDLAESLDSMLSTPLHLASAKGYVEIVIELVGAKPDTCTAVDKDGLNPLHLAVIKGKVDVLRALVRARPDAALARVDHGETTILHLCVKYYQMGALTLLLESEDEQILGLINARDEYGNSILHLAVSDKQVKTVKYLLEDGRVDVNATNKNGYTALDILAQSRRDVNDWDIGNSLREAKALKAADISSSSDGIARDHFAEKGSNSKLPSSSQCSQTGKNFQAGEAKALNVAHDQDTKLAESGNNPQLPSSSQGSQTRNNVYHDDDWLANALMIVASLLTTMAFQAGVSPPGGVWQDNSVPPINQKPHRAGEAVVAYNYPETYMLYLRANTIGFVASLSTILLLISGLPFRQRGIFLWILVVIMGLSITSMAFTYAFSIVAVTPKWERGPLRRTMYVAVPVWCGVMALMLLGHVLTAKWLKTKGNRSVRKPSNSVASNNANDNQNVELQTI